MAGRHAVGQQMARTGSIRGGQSEPSGNRPITASRPQNRPAPPVLANQAETSRTAQRMIPRPPMPFENPRGTVGLAAPVHPYFNNRKSKDNVYYDGGSPVNPNQKAGGYKATSASIHNGTATTDDMLAAVGEPRRPSGYNSITSGFPTTGGRRQSGRPGNVNTSTTKRDNARMRQRPGGF